MSTLNPRERRQTAKIGALTSWANTADRTARTQPGREAFLARFEDQVDPERRLSSSERAKRAEAAKKAYFAGLALKSARARRGRSRGQQPTETGTSPASVGHLAAAAQTLSAEQRSELAALLLTGGGRT